MYIKIIGLYGIPDHKAWFRKLGDCFDFVNRKEFASNLTREETETVMAYSDWYCNQYDAEMMVREGTV